MPPVPQEGRDLLGRGDGECVDDPRARQLVKMVREPGEPVCGVRQRQHAQAQTLPVQRPAQHQRLGGALTRTELLGDVGGHPGVGRGRGGEHGHTRRKVGEHRAQPSVVRPEVMTPVRDAVRLVDDQQAGRRRELGQHLITEIGVVQPLRAHQQDIHVAGRHLGLDGVPLLGVGGVDRARADPGPRGRLDLITHQREQRGDDHGRSAAALPQQRRRDEIDRGLAPARALHDQRAAVVGDQRLDRPPLIFAQPGRAAGIPDETGQDGIGCGTQLFVAHAPCNPMPLTSREPRPEAVDNLVARELSTGVAARRPDAGSSSHESAQRTAQAHH